MPVMSNFILLEFGSKSLKVHRKRGDGQFEKVTVPWKLGHEVYREGKISSVSRDLVRKVLDRLEERGFQRKAMLAIGTGAVRDALDRDDFIAFLEKSLRIKLRILTGREEASLLAQGFVSLGSKRPALGLDIGGGSLQTVYLETEISLLRDCLPLGAIRLHYLGTESGKAFNHGFVADYIEGVLRDASVIQVPVVYGTGGPVKAVAKVLERDDMDLGLLESLEERVLREGPPPGLTEERSLIFLPGVMVLRRLLVHTRAGQLRYRPIPIGKMFLERFLGKSVPEYGVDPNAQLLEKLRVTQIFKPD